MKILLAANLASLALSFTPVPIPPFLVQPASSKLAYKTRYRPGSGIRANNYGTLVMSAAEDEGEGAFTRKKLLEGVTKASGVLAAGTFVQRGFFAGVTYHGKPDLCGRVSFEKHDNDSNDIQIMPPPRLPRTTPRRC